MPSKDRSRALGGGGLWWLAIIHQCGPATYSERYSNNLQVDFDYRRYPFDDGEFAMRVMVNVPTAIYNV